MATPGAGSGASAGASRYPTSTDVSPGPETGPQPCSREGCTAAAVAAVRFHRQAGHVHECAADLAYLREWCDIAEVAPLPCPWVHTETQWIDYPRDLE
jgi:hypothetical protein